MAPDQRREAYVEALVREPATGRTWSGVEPPKRKARSVRRRQRRRPSHPFEALERALADRADSFHRASGFGIGPHAIRT